MVVATQVAQPEGCPGLAVEPIHPPLPVGGHGPHDPVTRLEDSGFGAYVETVEGRVERPPCLASGFRSPAGIVVQDLAIPEAEPHDAVQTLAYAVYTPPTANGNRQLFTFDIDLMGIARAALLNGQ